MFPEEVVQMQNKPVKSKSKKAAQDQESPQLGHTRAVNLSTIKIDDALRGVMQAGRYEPEPKLKKKIRRRKK